VLVSLVRQIELRAGPMRELTAPRDVVRMDVRFRNVSDAYPLPLGRADILVHVAVRVDDDRLARHRATNEIARLRKFLVEESLNDHRSNPPCVESRGRGGWIRWHGLPAAPPPLRRGPARPLDCCTEARSPSSS